MQGFFLDIKLLFNNHTLSLLYILLYWEFLGLNSVDLRNSPWCYWIYYSYQDLHLLLLSISFNSFGDKFNEWTCSLRTWTHEFKLSIIVHGLDISPIRTTVTSLADFFVTANFKIFLYRASPSITQTFNLVLSKCVNHKNLYKKEISCQKIEAAQTISVRQICLCLNMFHNGCTKYCIRA